ncbi:hypothetical protein ACHQM5_000275 [Ranunculus cassubicifolius]
MITSCLTIPAKTLTPSFKQSIPSRPKTTPHNSIKQHQIKPVHPPLTTQENIQPDLQTYSALLKSCIRSHDYDQGKLIHAQLLDSGLKFNNLINNSLISLYSKCGDLEKAISIFQGMNDHKDLVSWSCMISCFANNGRKFEAIMMFYEMLRNGFYPNEYCFTAVIRACVDGENAWIGRVMFGFIVKTGYLEANLCVGCELIDLFTKGMNDVVSARKVFDQMPERNAVTWTLMITRYAQCGCAVDAVELFLDMEDSEFRADRFTLSSVVSACAELEAFRLGQQLHSRAIRSGLASDVFVGCSLVDMYAKCSVDGSIDMARKVFDGMPNHNVIAWTAIITGYSQCGGRDHDAIDIFRKMRYGHILPNHFTFSSVLKACANISDSKMGEQVHALVVKLGLASINVVGNSLINMFVRSGRMEDARKAFDILFEKNLISFNTIVDGYSKNSNSEEAFHLFHQIESMGIGASSFTFASLLSGAATIGALSKGEQLHARLLKEGLDSDQRIGNALISMYSRCGNVEAAFQVFNKMDNRNVVSWTSMITGFAKHGYAGRALDTFHGMSKAGVKPNEVTYISVLSACSHVGLFTEGWEHFNSMQKVHNIIPRMEHYACMVDLLGRSGLLKEALEFIDSMPCKADALVWRTLLGACRVQGNMELGKVVTKRILDLDPHDPAAYVLLSNLYASTGQWDDVENIRKTMKDRKLTKEAGCSWTEVENKVHKFYVGDTSHARAHEIFSKLDQLACEIKELGYVPNVDFVLHDVPDEQKEQYLFQHSEKIALAFGLISTSESKTIRIFKNLRVCGDCHSAMKFISITTKREIVVRDSNRFHHIKDGICSCNDYW